MAGTPLRGINLMNWVFTQEDDIVKSMVANGSVLDMPQFQRLK